MSGWEAIPIRSACEAPLRGAGVRAVVPAAPGPRGPGAVTGARDGQHGPAMSGGSGPFGGARPGLMATRFFPRPFGVGSRRGEGGLRAAGPGVGPFLKGLIL